MKINKLNLYNPFDGVCRPSLVHRKSKTMIFMYFVVSNISASYNQIKEK